jgi:hypothetical protein
MKLSNLLLLGSLVLPAATAGQSQVLLAVQIYVPFEATEYANITAKLLGPDVETISSPTFNETNAMCIDESFLFWDRDKDSEECIGKPRWVKVALLGGITADEVRTVNISMPHYELTVSL